MRVWDACEGGHAGVSARLIIQRSTPVRLIVVGKRPEQRPRQVDRVVMHNA